jgi:hypothetical protein
MKNRIKSMMPNGITGLERVKVTPNHKETNQNRKKKIMMMNCFEEQKVNGGPVEVTAPSC